MNHKVDREKLKELKGDVFAQNLIIDVNMALGNTKDQESPYDVLVYYIIELERRLALQDDFLRTVHDRFVYLHNKVN